MDDEVDMALNDHMINLSKAEELCNSRRTPFTRMIQGAVKVFTAIEKYFKDERDFFQKKRDEYAQAKLREKKEKEAEAARRLAVNVNGISYVILKMQRMISFQNSTLLLLIIMTRLLTGLKSRIPNTLKSYLIRFNSLLAHHFFPLTR
jgi:hypothetical protein